MDMAKITEKIDAIQVPAGYTVAGVVGATPIWVQTLTGWFELLAVLFAVLVGATTLWINLERIFHGKKNAKKDA